MKQSSLSSDFFIVRSYNTSYMAEQQARPGTPGSIACSLTGADSTPSSLERFAYGPKQDARIGVVDSNCQTTINSGSPALPPLHGPSDHGFLKQVVCALDGNNPDLQGIKAPRPWRTTFIRFGPLSGIFCMLLAIASIFASLGILAASNKTSVTSWTATPSTYLAICTAIANLSMRYACVCSVPNFVYIY